MKKALPRLVLRVDDERWGQTPAALHQLALSAAHPRSRERFLALHDIAQGSCATEVAERTAHRPHTMMDWMHAYNNRGPEALVYQRTGGRPLFAQTSRPRSAKKSARPSNKPSARR